MLLTTMLAPTSVLDRKLSSVFHLIFFTKVFGRFLGQSAQESDLALFDTRYGFKNQSFAVQLINGGVNVQNSSASDGEANLGETSTSFRK